MHKVLPLVMCFFTSFFSFSQQSDFLSLKKKDRTIKNYFKGAPIEFVHVNGYYISGIIERIYKDTLYVKQYDVRMAPTFWGTRTRDTMGHYDLRFHYKEISSIPKPEKSFEFVRNGTLFMIAGGGYAFLHTFNSLIQKTQIDRSTPHLTRSAFSFGPKCCAALKTCVCISTIMIAFKFNQFYRFLFERPVMNSPWLEFYINYLRTFF